MRETFWEFTCAALPVFVLLFVLDIVLLVLLAASALFVEPSSGTYYISILSAGLLVVSLAGSVFVIRRCRKREWGGGPI